MKNSEYWAKRFEKLEQSLNKMGNDTYFEIEPAFYQAQKEIKEQIEIWLVRVAKNNEITLTQARKLLDARELAEFKWDVFEYIKRGKENAINQQWIKQLENASARFHISRLEALQINMQQSIEMAFGNELDEVDKMAKKTFTESYYNTCFELQKGLNACFRVGEIDNNKLQKIISKPWTADGKTFSDRIWKSKASMINELQTELTRTCILGKAPNEAINSMTKYVDNRFSNAKAQAGRLVRTEQAFFASTAQKEAFNDLDVEEYEIVATLDLKTSSVCQEMDGKHFPMKDFKEGVTAPPFHPWCRSCTCPYFDDEFSQDGYRASRNDEGKTVYEAPANMTYPEWKKKFVDGELKTGDNGGKIKSVQQPKKVETVQIDTVQKVENVDDKLKNNNKNIVQEVEQLEIIQPVKNIQETNYTELTLEEFKKMKHSVTKEERKIIYGKSHFSGYINSSNARIMNGELRVGKKLSDEYEVIKNTLDKVIAKNTLPKDIKVIRYVDGDALEQLFGVKYPRANLKTNIKEYWGEVENLPQALGTDKTYIEKGFLSTSGVFDKNVFQDRGVILKIKSPKGTNAYITTNNKESEIIFGRDTTLKLVSSTVENVGTSRWKLILECEIK